VFLLACTCARPVPEAPPPHYEGVVDLRLAVEAGDIDGFKAAARLLEGDQDDAGGLHGALGFAQVSEDVDDASFAAARVVEACGSCHTGLSTEVRLSSHADVAETLWDGVLVGDDEVVAQAVAAWELTELGEDPLAEVLASCVGCHE
jgi:hypothetical protein